MCIDLQVKCPSFLSDFKEIWNFSSDFRKTLKHKILWKYFQWDLTQYCAGDKIEKNEMGWACGTYGKGEGGVLVLGGETGGKETTGETYA